MKKPLNYQVSEYDCGPTTMHNAISFLFQRQEIPPDVVRYITFYSLDAYNDKGESGKNGTSRMAMMFLSSWLNQFAKCGQFPISCEYISGHDVKMEQNSRIAQALQLGGAVVVRVYYGEWHYVLLTGIRDNEVSLFDPYFRKRPFKQTGISLVTNEPFTRNRIVDTAFFNSEKRTVYAFGPKDTREAVLLFNNHTRLSADKTIEYFI